MADDQNDSSSLSVFTDQGLTPQQEQVCTLLATGKTVEQACALAKITDYRYTKWLADVPAFERTVRIARAILIDRRMNRLAHIAQTEPDVNRARLMIDTDKWLASKLIPKVYGDKLDINMTQTIDITDARAAAVNRVFVRPMCDPAYAIDGQFEVQQGLEPYSAVDKESTLPPELPDIFS